MHPPIQSNLFIQESIMSGLSYADFKEILLDWAVMVAKASIDGPRSVDDKAVLRKTCSVAFANFPSLI